MTSTGTKRTVSSSPTTRMPSAPLSAIVTTERGTVTAVIASACSTISALIPAGTSPPRLGISTSSWKVRVCGDACWRT